MQGCTDANGFACLDRTTTGSSLEQEFSAMIANSAATKTKTAAAKTDKRPSAHVRDKPHPVAEKNEPAVAATKVEPSVVEHSASDQPAETSDLVIAKAKNAVSARFDDPASAEFGEMKRAMRKNTLGQSVDTICGRVKAKTASGEDTGDKPFLYLVKDDEAYVVDGAPNSVAASAYRNICN
jgi:hypothetical protein